MPYRQRSGAQLATEFNVSHIDEALNEMERQGWTLVAMAHWPGPQHLDNNYVFHKEN